MAAEPADLLALTAFADLGSIARTADQLRLDPATVLRRLRRLERAVGVPLLDTASGGQVRPTPAAYRCAELTRTHGPGVVGMPVAGHRLRVVTAVARTGSLRGAAAELGLAPAAVSRLLSRLEAEHGPLFQRSPTGTVATAAGMRLAELAAQLAELDRLLRTVRSGRPYDGPLRVAVAEPFFMLLDLLARALPDRELRPILLPPEAALAALGDGTADLAISRATPGLPLERMRSGAPAPIEVAPLLEEPIWILVGEGHPLAGRPSVDLADLHEVEWVTRPSSSMDAYLAELHRRWGIAPRVRHVLDHDAYGDVLVSLLATTNAVCPCRATSDAAPGTVVVPITGAMTLTRVLLWRSDVVPTDVVATVSRATLTSIWTDFLDGEPHFVEHVRAHPDRYAEFLAAEPAVVTHGRGRPGRRTAGPAVAPLAGRSGRGLHPPGPMPAGLSVRGSAGSPGPQGTAGR